MPDIAPSLLHLSFNFILTKSFEVDSIISPILQNKEMNLVVQVLSVTNIGIQIILGAFTEHLEILCTILR